MVKVNDECLIFYMLWLQTVTESIWKILKLDWKTLQFVLFQKSGNPVCCQCDELSFAL